MDKDKTAIALKNKENQEEFLPSYNDLDIQGMIYWFSEVVWIWS